MRARTSPAHSQVSSAHSRLVSGSAEIPNDFTLLMDWCPPPPDTPVGGGRRGEEGIGTPSAPEVNFRTGLARFSVPDGSVRHGAGDDPKPIRSVRRIRDRVCSAGVCAAEEAAWATVARLRCRRAAAATPPPVLAAAIGPMDRSAARQPRCADVVLCHKL
ncbi:unnamed protein product [Merluccius merluccius]